MTPDMLTPGIEPRNALIEAAAPPALAPSRAALNVPALLASTIGHAALLSDTPEKWASTIAMLRQNGVDPEHFADFEKGRPAAMAAAGPSGQARQTG
jgi:hypothetical protein